LTAKYFLIDLKKVIL